MTGSGHAVGTIEELVAYFRDGETPREHWRIGLEHEKIGVLSRGHERLSYEGERGISVVLARIAEADDWGPVYEGEKVIALQKSGASITLEPGGQIELSGEPLATVRQTCAEFTSHVDLVKRVSEDLGIAWLSLGADPFHEVGRIPFMPKARYEIMRSYLPTRGSMALHMMQATATVQANFDYPDEAGMAAMMRTAMGCSPVISAIFANSSISEGGENGFISRRMEIWRHTDPDRCGLLPFVFERDFGYREYAEWALDVPMFFLLRDHRYIPLKGTTFRDFMNHGYAEQRATLDDWELHLTTLFPDVRLKRFIEVRGADAVPSGLTCALPAIWKGIFYDERALEAAWGLVQSWSQAQREDALVDVARRGLGAVAAGRPVLDLARELTDISAEGLRRIAERGDTDRDERSFLDPIREQLAIGKSPGQVVLDNWRGAWQGSLERLIEYARY